MLRFKAALKAVAVVVLLGALVSCSRPVDLQPPPGHVPKIRVLLFDNLDKVTVSIAGPYEIRLAGGSGEPRKLTSGDELRGRAVRAVGVDVVVEEVIRTRQAVEFVPHSAPVKLNGRRYRGSLRISSRKGKLRIVNVLDLEGYLRGVVPCEMYPEWPMAALRAQAVAARSYALARIDESADRPFDVYATVRSQAYGGFDRETPATGAAVSLTAGEVLLYGGRVLKAYYHACCGGWTADAGEVFAEPAPPFKVSTCGYCDKAPGSKWSFKISKTKLAAKLRVPNVSGLGLQGIGLDGRVTQVTLHRPGKQDLVMAGTTLRRRIGDWKTLTGRAEGMFSTRFKVRTDGDYFVFDGRGWGHGVGMCQWGAKGMADVGASHTAILGKYYPGVKIRKAY